MKYTASKSQNSSKTLLLLRNTSHHVGRTGGISFEKAMAILGLDSRFPTRQGIKGKEYEIEFSPQEVRD